MFSRIFVETDVKDHPQTVRMLEQLKQPPVTYLHRVEDVFGRVKKPYLHKRNDQQLFIGKKRGQLIKPTPPAYGHADTPHYYFIHAYNCIFECEYCYLQGYFDSPDLVLFVNHDEICSEIIDLCQVKHQLEPEVWFHAGEFSDSLALASLTGEWEMYWETFADLPNGYLELRTKSHNIRPIIELPVVANIIPSFSLAPAEAAARFDRKTPPLAARLRAMAKLAKRGYQLGVHFDPIIDTENLEAQYKVLTEELLKAVPSEQIRYLSLGVVRFTKDVFRAVEKNYPNSPMLAADFTTSFDQKVRYRRPHRLAILNRLKALCVDLGIAPEKIYFCME